MDFTQGYDNITRYDGLIVAPPAAGDPLAYDEALTVFLLTRIWEILIALCHVQRDDVVFAPEGGHQLNDALVAHLKLAPSVVSLMRKMPYFKSAADGTPQLIHEGSPLSFLHDQDLVLGRDPNYLHTIGSTPATEINFLGIDEFYLRPQDTGLVTPSMSWGKAWVLDTEASERASYLVSSSSF